MAVAAPLPLREGDRRRLEALTRSTSVRAGLAQRARIVLLAADGVPNAEIARRTGSTRPTVLAWRSRYAAGGLDALGDKPRSGRPAEVDEIEVVATTLADDGRPPAHLGVTHWSSRLLAKELGVSYATVARIWRKWGIQPDRLDTFQFHIGPELDAEVDQFYRTPPGHSVVPRPSQVPATGSQPAGRSAQQADPWLSLVEVSLGILIRQAVRRGSLASVHNLIEAIGALTDGGAEPAESSVPAVEAPTPTVQDDRKGTSNTQRPCRPPARAEVDLRRNPDRLSLRAEFHGAHSELTGRPDSQTS
ncbi:MAG TPA: helix-turn-helix domain-containing protein [Pseudonocardiaceae bacterium]|jgi:transposase